MQLGTMKLRLDPDFVMTIGKFDKESRRLSVSAANRTCTL